MERRDREALLWQLTEVADPLSEDDGVSDTLLAAWRAGTLDTEAEARVVQALTRHAESRHRLLVQAESAPPPAPTHVLEQVLKQRGAPSRRRTPWAMAIAATLALVLFGWWFLRPPVVPPAYQVAAAGLAKARDGSGVGEARAYAATPVTVTATVVDVPRAGFSVALYRHQGDRLDRVDQDERVQRTERRGVVRFTARAAVLIGTDLGRHPVYVVVGRSHDLPDQVDVGTAADPIAILAAGGRRNAYRLPIRLMQPDPEPLAAPDGPAPPDEENENALDR